MQKTHLECVNIVKAYGNIFAVDNISLEVDDQEFITILGPSGSGKTTLLKIIAGIIKPDSGQILLDGRDISSVAAHKRNIGVVFQNYALFPNMTVFGNIAYPLQVRRMSKEGIRERVERMLGLVQLEDFGNRFPHQLSGGQQQRVALARATVFEPKLVLMDEPLGALDKKLRDKMQLEIKHFQKNLGMTVLYVTHDQVEALSMSDRIAILDRGQLLQIDTPIDIYKSPNCQFVAEFIGDICLIKGIVSEITDESSGGVVFGGKVFYYTRRQNSGVLKDNEINLMIRPEALVDLSNNISKGDLSNRISVEILEVVYGGEFTVYLLKLPDGQIIRMKVNNFSGIKQHFVGDSIKIGWRPEDLREI